MYLRSHGEFVLSPYVSIVCAAYNAEHTIEETVLSVIEQTDSRFELILIDDGSFDSTNELCLRACALDARVSLYTTDHIGRVLARQKGIKASKGNYIVVIDADDCCAPNLVETLIGAAENHQTPDVIIFDFSLLGANNRKGLSKVFPGFFEGNAAYIPRRWLLFNYFNPLWQKAFRKEILLCDRTDYTQYDHPMGEDLLMSLAPFDLAKSFLVISDVLYLYRPTTNIPTYSRTFLRQRFNPYLFERKLYFAHRWEFDKLTVMELWREALSALAREFELLLSLFGGKTIYTSVRDEDWLSFVHPEAKKMIHSVGLAKRDMMLLVGLRWHSPIIIRSVLFFPRRIRGFAKKRGRN